MAAITLDTFNRHADKLVMANIAQVANVLQSMVLTEGERMLLTPTYHVFDLYQPHQGGQSLRTVFDAPAVTFAVGDDGADTCPACSGRRRSKAIASRCRW